MRKKDIMEIYGTLNACKLTGMTTAGKLSVIAALRALRPVAEAHEKEVSDILEKSKPEGFDDTLRRAREHNEAVQAGKGPVMTADELLEAAKEIEAYNKEANEAVERLLAEEVDIAPDKLDKADLGKLMDANDLEAGKLEAIARWLSN